MRRLSSRRDYLQPHRRRSRYAPRGHKLISKLFRGIIDASCFDRGGHRRSDCFAGNCVRTRCRAGALCRRAHAGWKIVLGLDQQRSRLRLLARVPGAACGAYRAQEEVRGVGCRFRNGSDGFFQNFSRPWLVRSVIVRPRPLCFMSPQDSLASSRPLENSRPATPAPISGATMKSHT